MTKQAMLLLASGFWWGCTGGSGVAHDAAVADAGLPVAPTPCPEILSAASLEGDTRIYGPDYVDYPPPTQPPALFLTPYGPCVGLRVDADPVDGHLVLRGYSLEVEDWSLTALPADLSAPYPRVRTTLGEVRIDRVDLPLETLDFRFEGQRAASQECGSRFFASFHVDAGGLVVTGYSTGSCPSAGTSRSRRAFKDGIEYTSSGELERLRDEVMALRLARFRYREEDPDVQRLGVILDDLPAESSCVTADPDAVDLYAYTSMVIATAQVQERELRELRARLEALESDLASSRAPGDVGAQGVSSCAKCSTYQAAPSTSSIAVAAISGHICAPLPTSREKRSR